jgi:transketolase
MSQSFDRQRAKAYCADYRLKILAMSQKVTALHIAPAFSCLEMVEAIYHWVKKPEDTFLMSKGHGCLVQYIILEELGTLQKKDIEAYCTKEGRLGAHPDYGVPGIAAATGSLGHGLGMAVGMAYANQVQGKPGVIYVVISDGELQEGSTWEAVMMATNLRLDNLVVCVDFNDFTSFGRLSEGHPAIFPVAEKWMVFGWQAEVIDGHDSEAVYRSLTKARTKPSVIIGKTVKGKGVSFMESVPVWHYRSPNAEEYQKAVRELSEKSS